MKTFCWVVTLLSACVAALVLIVGLQGATGAPQEASVAAIACCIAVVPYVFTKAIEGLDNETNSELKKIIRLIEEAKVKSSPENKNHE